MKVLLVEGIDEQMVIQKLVDIHNVSINDIEIKNKKGRETLLKSLRTEVQTPGLSIIGLVLDADQKLAETWQSIIDRLKKGGYQKLPKKPSEKGTIIQSENKPTVGVWIMPNNKNFGVLEDFVAYLIPDKDNSVLWRYANQCVSKLPVQELLQTQEKHVDLTNDSQKSKALIHTYLAWQESPGRDLSQAILERDCALNAQAKDAIILLDWLRNLFSNSNYSTIQLT